jgi:hypothetical protein
MARTSQTTQVAVGYLLDPNLTAANVDGDIVDCGDIHVWVHNGAVAPINVTVQTTATVGGLDVADLVVPVPAGADALIGPLPKTLFGRSDDPDKGRAYVDYSAVTDVTRAVVKP